MSQTPLAWTPASISRSLFLAMAAILAASTGIRAVVHLTGHDYILGLVPLLYVDKESNIPTLFSVGLLLADALALAIVASLEKSRGSKWTLAWQGLSVGFVVIAADEFMSFHERLTVPIRRLADGAAGDLFHYGWVALAIPVVLVILAAYWRFLRALPAATRKAFLVAGACFVGGAVGVELLGGIAAARLGEMSVTHSVLATVEEGLEMVGCILFLEAVLVYAGRSFGGVILGRSAEPS